MFGTLRRVLTAGLLVTAPCSAVAQQPPEWTIDDLLLQESAVSFDFSPDGRLLVWTRSQLDRESGKRHTNLWLTRLDDGESWALTHGKETHAEPRFSPDGSLIVFTSTREPPEKNEAASGAQLWALRSAGGEAFALTGGLRGLRQWTFKGTSSDTIVFSASELQTERDQARKKRSDTGYAAGAGNTLDHWVGYAPNPDDVQRLQAALARLPGGAPLLREAGSFPADASGEAAAYDLNGNVAEWAVRPDGSGVASNPSAERPRDQAARASSAAPGYRGLRVVLTTAPVTR